jgi:hypothetical protein
MRTVFGQPPSKTIPSLPAGFITGQALTIDGGG